MNKSVRLGVQIDSIDSDYDKGLIEGISSYCQDQGSSLLVFAGRAFGWPYGFEYQSSAVYQHISRNNIDALILASGTQCNFITAEMFANYLAGLQPLLLVSVSIELPGITSVVVDNEKGFVDLLDHLFDAHACRRIAIMTGPNENAEACMRFDAYRRFLEKRGIAFNSALALQADFTAEKAVQSLQHHLEQYSLDFDALVCLNDTMAIGCLHHFEQLGIRVPEDVILTGFDDIVRARYEYPTLTTVSQDLISQGRLAAQYAHDLYYGKEVPPLTRLNTRAIFRQSCGCVETGSSPSVATGDDSARKASAPSVYQVAGINWFKMQDNMIRFRHYLTHLMTVLSLSDLVEDLRPALESFGIKSCAIVTYREEIKNSRCDNFRLPDSAYLLFYYDETTPMGQRQKPVQFNPRETLYPAAGHTQRNRVLVATALYQREQQLGYIVYEPGDLDRSLCEPLCVQLSSTIRYAQVFASKINAISELEKRRQEQQTLITKLEEAQNQLLQSEKLASIGQLAAGVAHEINNPIGFVNSNLGSLEHYVADLIRLIEAYIQAEINGFSAQNLAAIAQIKSEVEFDFLRDDIRELVRESRDGLDRVKRIIQDLKDFSRVDQKPVWQSADINRCLESTLNVAANELKHKAEVIRDFGQIPEVECLASQINQVFLNMMVNAAQAIKERGTIRITTGSENDWVWIEFADTGSGIAPEHLHRVFEPFFTTKAVGKGTGLGLSLSYSIVARHNGRIEVESEVGEGATFRIWLPIHHQADPQVS